MRNRTALVFMVLVVMAVSVRATVDSLHIRGTVISGGRGVAGAVVTLLGYAMKDTTDENGLFSIRKNFLSVAVPEVTRAQNISFRSGILTIYLSKGASAKIGLYTGKGHLLKKEVLSYREAGVYQIDIAAVSLASQLLIIKVSTGTATMQYRYIPLRSGSQAMRASLSRSTSSFTRASEKVADAVDSLEVVKQGFKTGKVAVRSYHETTDITLFPADFVEDAAYDCTGGSSIVPNRASDSTLPDPFTMWDGTVVKTMEQWRCRRSELANGLESIILGTKAPPPAEIGGTVSGTISDSGYTVVINNPEGSTTFNGTIHLPDTGSAPYPAVIITGESGSVNREVCEREGVATLSYDYTAIAAGTSHDFATGNYFEANPDYKLNSASLVAWSWGVSRIIDMLEQHPEVIDPTKIAVYGCAEAGKAAFVAGAFDQRIVLSILSEPGTGGPAPLRSLPSLGGLTLLNANNKGSWFHALTKHYNPLMAIDMNDVAVLHAPRGLLVMDNANSDLLDTLGYKATYLGCAAAYEVYKAMGKEEALWYVGNSENPARCAHHDEYTEPLITMIRKFLKGDTSGTTGGLDIHANHGEVAVERWIDGWDIGVISE